MPPRLLMLAAALGATPALAAGPLELATTVLAEHKVAAADGTTRIDWVPAVRAVPGDRVTVRLAYRNTGRQPIADLVLANPVPAGLAYRGPVPGSPEPEVSADGRRFAPIAALTVAGHPATPDEITHVRWRLVRPLASGTGGSLGFRAVLK